MALAVGVACTAASAQLRWDFGKREYDNSCAGCHGAGAKGDGPLAQWLIRPPSDLTTLARRNGGIFPYQQIAETIDGRAAGEPGPHGTRDMPIWGSVYRTQGARPSEGDFDPEWTARTRIAALIDYLARIQQR